MPFKHKHFGDPTKCCFCKISDLYLKICFYSLFISTKCHFVIPYMGYVSCYSVHGQNITGYRILEL